MSRLNRFVLTAMAGVSVVALTITIVTFYVNYQYTKFVNNEIKILNFEVLEKSNKFFIEFETNTPVYDKTIFLELMSREKNIGVREFIIQADGKVFSFSENYPFKTGGEVDIFLKILPQRVGRLSQVQECLSPSFTNFPFLTLDQCSIELPYTVQTKVLKGER